MKVVILAGGRGTRLMEKTQLMPKPMVEIGGKPMLWHIMKIYESYGFDDFIICLGYKGFMIKEYFMKYQFYDSEFTIDLSNGQTQMLKKNFENFKVTLVETGIETNTAGRIHKIKKYLDGETFMLTYGDGLSDVNINNLLEFHNNTNSIVTLTSITSPNSFGIIESDSEGLVKKFNEKPKSRSKINGGFFVMDPSVFDYLGEEHEKIQWEKGPLQKIAKEGKLSAFTHNGFWKCMDALRDKIELENLWASGNARWKIW